MGIVLCVWLIALYLAGIGLGAYSIYCVFKQKTIEAIDQEWDTTEEQKQYAIKDIDKLQEEHTLHV